MKIFDRYNGDSSAERRRYEERLARARRGIREDYDRLSKLGVAMFIVFFMLVIALGIFGDRISDAAWILAGSAALFLIAAFAACYFVFYKSGNAEQPDLYIFGMENDDFLLLNPLYEELDRISPGEVEEIRIIAAMRPTTRQPYTDRNRYGRDRYYGDRTHYEYYGESIEEGGYEQTTPHPMAVLCGGRREFDWRWIDDPIFRRDLQQWIAFVPFGENAQPFVQLLGSTGCPVVIVREVYDAHWPALDTLFVQAGMDMSRLEFMKENPEQAKMTKIIG